MTDAQRHRGPDDFGLSYFSFGPHTLGLGHRRLSILDLSPAGHQPMTDPATGSQIIFNGEIYNFQVLRDELLNAGQSFRGHSDTEVMLYGLSRWGPAYVARLQGMFAFAFYDARERSLLLARDSLGIKPLYVARTAEAILFASEVRALLASGLVPRQLDRVGTAGLLAYGCVQAPHTIIRGVESFPSGTYQLLRAEETCELPHLASSPKSKFWSFPRHSDDVTEAQAVESVRRTLDDAVRDHLVADVPVGVFLSSGLDSTIVAGLAAKHSPRIRSFTVGFADQPDLSEAKLAAETADLFGLTHTNIDIASDTALNSVIGWLDALDQPSMDGLNVYVISKVVREQGITVALSGQGGDELFGGYPSFQDVPRLRKALRPLQFLPPVFRGALGDLLALPKSTAVRHKLHDMLRGDGTVTSLCLQRRRTMSSRQIAALGVEPGPLGLSDDFMPRAALDDLPNGEDLVRSVSELESRFYQANMLLRDGDANGMAHSLEIRVPVLDQRVIDLVYRIPGRIRLPSGRADKYLLRKAFPEYLRPALLEQKKKGFTLPIRRWMTGPLREMCELSLRTLKSVGILRPQGIDSLWNTFDADPESPVWSRAFSLVVLGHYVRRMNLVA